MAPRATTTEAPELPAELTVPEDLSPENVDNDQLDTYLAAVRQEMDALADRAANDPASISPDDVARSGALNAAEAALTAESSRRATEQADAAAAVLGNTRREDAPAADGDPADDEDTDGDTPAEAPEGDPAPASDPAPAAPAPNEGAPVEAVAASTAPARAPLTIRRPTLNPVGIAGNAPRPSANRPRPELVLTAASDIPGLVPGTRINTLDDLVAAVTARAVSMGITQGRGAPMPVASIQRSFAHVLDEGASLAQVDAAFKDLLGNTTTAAGMAALVAAGGWCAPSEIDYSLFDVTDAPAGQVDIPTIGIRRGGIRWPESLDLAQFFGLAGAPASGIGTNATMPWLWTEADDIAATTGSPTKLCMRPPCPDFNEERLWLLGICVLAGNLTEDAYPEVIRHFLGLVEVAHARVMNRRILALMAGHSSVVGVTPTKGAASSAVTHFLAASDLQATSERARLGMSRNAVMEQVIPFWVQGLLRSDISKRNGWDDLSVADSWFSAQLDARNIRAQWVEDWQSNTGWNGGATIGADTAPTSWPSSFTTLMYPPGHFFRGNGMTLNLGVVRDSVLNETNDHTAAWSEEAALVGARGNRALSITYTDMFTNGRSGAQVDQTAVSA